MGQSKGKPQRIGTYKSAHEHKMVTPHAVEGQRITWVYDTDHHWDRYDSNVTAPDGRHLFNFDLPVGDLGSLLVLDNYGDEELDEGEMRKRLLQNEMFSTTIGIYRETGEIVRVGFIEEIFEKKTHFAAVTWASDWSQGDSLFVPPEWLKQIDRLKSQKRPFRFSVDKKVLLSFVDREASYSDLQKSLTVELDFPDARLELSSLGYRVTTYWEDTH